MSYRAVRHGYEGDSTYQFIPCKHYVTIHHNMDFNFCPYCGAEVGSQLDCRKQGFPAWAWRIGLREWDELPPVKDAERLHWELESRHVRPESYEGFASDLFDWTAEFWVSDRRSMLEIIREHQREGGMFWVQEFRMVLKDQNDNIRRVIQKESWKVFPERLEK